MTAVVIRERTVVHDLQQEVEYVRMGLLDLIEEHHRVGVLDHLLGEQPALVEADVARGGTDQPRDRVTLHVLRHVEAHHVDTHLLGELAGDLGLAHARRTGEEERAHRLAGVPQPGA